MSMNYMDKADVIYILAQLKTKIDAYLNDYVKKEAGKDLSANDLTNDLVAEIGKVKDKANSASPAFTGVPTAPTAALGTSTTQIATTNFVMLAVAKAVGEITGIKFEKVQELPSTGVNGVIYLLRNTGAGQNIYDEYFWTGDGYELMGTTAVDLSGYVQSTDLVPITESEIDAMFANW